MIPPTDWEPTSTDIAWQQSWLNLLAQNAVWGVPASESAFKFDKAAKTFYLAAGDPAHETNRRIAKILKLLGYSEVNNPGATNADDAV